MARDLIDPDATLGEAILAVVADLGYSVTIGPVPLGAVEGIRVRLEVDQGARRLGRDTIVHYRELVSSNLDPDHRLAFEVARSTLELEEARRALV